MLPEPNVMVVSYGTCEPVSTIRHVYAPKISAHHHTVSRLSVYTRETAMVVQQGTRYSLENFQLAKSRTVSVSTAIDQQENKYGITIPGSPL